MRRIAACGLLSGCAGLKQALAEKNKNAAVARLSQQQALSSVVCAPLTSIKKLESECVSTSAGRQGKVI